MCSTDKAVRIMQEVCSSCNAVFERKISEAYLYGSYARGDFHDESDIDILITVDESPENLSTYRKQIAKICSALGLAQDIMISATVKSSKQFKEYIDILPFYKNVVKEGIRYVAS